MKKESSSSHDAFGGWHYTFLFASLLLLERLPYVNWFTHSLRRGLPWLVFLPVNVLMEHCPGKQDKPGILCRTGPITLSAYVEIWATASKMAALSSCVWPGETMHATVNMQCTYPGHSCHTREQWRGPPCLRDGWLCLHSGSKILQHSMLFLLGF